jgi:carbon storage regulator
MLVLTRRIGEEIIIAENIRVRVAAVKGRSVRLGITAPSSVCVARRELFADPPDGQDRERPGEDGRLDGLRPKRLRRRHDSRT